MQVQARQVVEAIERVTSRRGQDASCFRPPPFLVHNPIHTWFLLAHYRLSGVLDIIRRVPSHSRNFFGCISSGSSSSTHGSKRSAAIHTTPVSARRSMGATQRCYRKMRLDSSMLMSCGLPSRYCAPPFLKYGLINGVTFLYRIPSSLKRPRRS